jgi:peroxiredoxin Q/BCP
MKSLVFGTIAATWIAFLAVPAAAGQAGPATTRIDLSKLGPQVGERVPDFSLKDQTGKTQTRQSIMGPRGAVLVFVRSTDWCPYCKTQLVELQGRAKSLQAQGLGIAVISYDSQDAHARFSEQRGITFPLLADLGSETIKRFGLLNPVPAMALGPDKDDPHVKALVQKYVSVVNPTARMVGIAFPGTFVLDRQGRVTSRFFEDFYIERTTMANLMVRTGAGNEEIAATKVSTGHLDLTTYTTDRDIAPGNRFSIVVEITPKPGVHVYAPGAKDYRIVALDIVSQPFLRTDAVTYPASEIYHFKPLDERVPVYQKPFRLVREVVLEGQPQAQAAYRGQESLTISGTLEYQACDDKVCFNPVALPLSWTIGLRPLLRNPAPPQSR